MAVEFNYSREEFCPASIGLSRILQIALDLGADVFRPVKWCDIQEEYKKRFLTPLNQAELKKYFKARSAKQVVSLWCQEFFLLPAQGPEDPQILMVQLRHPREDTIKYLARDLYVWHGIVG